MVKEINVVLSEQKVWKGKSKAILCASLGTALTIAQKERYANKQMKELLVDDHNRERESRLQAEAFATERDERLQAEGLLAAQWDHEKESKLQVEAFLAAQCDHMS